MGKHLLDLVKKSSKHMGHPTIKYRSSGTFVRVQHAVKQLRKGLLDFLWWEAKDCHSISKVGDVGNVKEGHFSVLTLGNSEPKKFLVALSYLAYPPFVELLEAAEREFGFDQQGVLAIPCEASELQRILS